MGADRVDRIVELIDEGLVSAEGQTCGEGVAYDGQAMGWPASGCDDPECWCHQEDVQAEVAPVPCDTCEPDCQACTGFVYGAPRPAFRSDGFTIRRVMGDGTLGEPIEGIVSVEAVAPVFPARMTLEELADLADCRDRIPTDYTAFHQQDVVPDE